MREKKPSEKTISKYLDLLKTLKTNSQLTNPYNAVKLKEFVRDAQVSKNVVKALKYLNIIKVLSEIKWEWNVGEPDRIMALTILDYNLHSRKAQEPALLEDQVTIITLLKKIISNQEKSLKEAKNETVMLQSDADNEKHFEIINSITRGMYTGRLVGELDIQTVSMINDTIIIASQNLFDKLK